MRKGQENGFLRNKHGDVIAINLGSDYCAEHEWGIKGIRRNFQYGDASNEDEVFGKDRRRIQAPPSTTEKYAQSFRWCKIDQGEGFIFTYNHVEKPYDYGFRKDQTLWTGWDEKSFGAFSTNAKEIANLRLIYQAILDGDAVCWLGGGGVFKNAGLCFGIISRMDQKIFADWDKADREIAQLKKDAEATGIAKELEAAGKQYFALSPRRTSDGKLTFWLNPCDQRNNNYGSFTVQELRDWIKGKGPIPKTSKQKREGSW